uniref:Uncharacterized protein n=1 Tax=Arundo donax TaxID=35708 RepID=A0A0A9I2T6_ARUDO
MAIEPQTCHAQRQKQWTPFRLLQLSVNLQNNGLGVEQYTRCSTKQTGALVAPFSQVGAPMTTICTDRQGRQDYHGNPSSQKSTALHVNQHA